MTSKFNLSLDAFPIAKDNAPCTLSMSLEAQNLLAADRQVNHKRVELKSIPGSQLKLDTGTQTIEVKQRTALADLSAKQLKELEDLTPATIKTCKQISDLLSQPTLSDEEKLRLQGFTEKINLAVTTFFDLSHNYERPLVTEQSLANSEGLSESLDKNWQQLQEISKQCRDANKTVYLQLHSRSDTNSATSAVDLKQALMLLSSSLEKLKYPISNLRTNSFTKEEEAEFEKIKKRRAAYFDSAINEEELRPFRKQYNLLKPYFEMINAYKAISSDITHLSCSAYNKFGEDTLLNNIGLKASGNMEPVDKQIHKEQAETKAHLEKNLDKFITLFNDPSVSALEYNNAIEPFIREEMLFFRRMGRVSIKDFHRLQAFVPDCNPDTQGDQLFRMRESSNMGSPASTIYNYEDAFEMKLKSGPKRKTFTKIDDIK